MSWRAGCARDYVVVLLSSRRLDSSTNTYLPAEQTDSVGAVTFMPDRVEMGGDMISEALSAALLWRKGQFNC